MNPSPIKCEGCGRFVSYEDLKGGLARYDWALVGQEDGDNPDILCQRCSKPTRTPCATRA